MPKIKVIHFYNGTGGGVLSVIRNLLKYSENPAIENHIVYTINKHIDTQTTFPKIEGAVSEKVFFYSAKWNFYYTCKQLAKLLPDDKAVVIAHDWLELGMMSNLGLQNPVVQFLHGDMEYYYNLAIKHQQSIDRYIAVSSVIKEKLIEKIPNRGLDIYYSPFPVPKVSPTQKENLKLKLFYCVRDLTEGRKQFKLLADINKILQQQNVEVSWTIIGAGLNMVEVEQSLNQNHDLLFWPTLPNEEVISLMAGHDVFILPSLKEGFPVVVVEAMKAGLVPLVTNWSGATEELIIENETGFYFEPGDARGYAETITRLGKDRNRLNIISRAAVKKANELFDPYSNTKQIEDVFINACSNKRQHKKAFKVYGSRLDKPWINNYFVKTLREFSKC